MQVDGNWTEMAEGFPKLEIKGSKKLIVFRFPKFSQKVFYDPTITMGKTPIEGSDEDPTEVMTTTGHPSAAHKASLSIAVLILSAMFSLR